MFTKSCRIYDAIYSFVDYKAEAEMLRQIIQEHQQSAGSELLDIACGTGQHASLLRDFFKIEGLDLQPEMLEIARERNPGIEFHHADMIDFQLNKRFDAIVCMFSSIGFVRTVENLRKASMNMARHLKPGGVLVIEPWVQPDSFIDGYVGAVFVDRPNFKVARINTSKIVNGRSILQMHYLVGSDDGIQNFHEEHELGLFTHEEYLTALQDAGLTVHYLEKGPKNKELYNRGLYVAIKPGT